VSNFKTIKDRFGKIKKKYYSDIIYLKLILNFINSMRTTNAKPKSKKHGKKSANK